MLCWHCLFFKRTPPAQQPCALAHLSRVLSTALGTGGVDGCRCFTCVDAQEAIALYDVRQTTTVSAAHPLDAIEADFVASESTGRLSNLLVCDPFSICWPAPTGRANPRCTALPSPRACFRPQTGGALASGHLALSGVQASGLGQKGAAISATRAAIHVITDACAMPIAHRGGLLQNEGAPPTQAGCNAASSSVSISICALFCCSSGPLIKKVSSTRSPKVLILASCRLMPCLASTVAML